MRGEKTAKRLHIGLCGPHDRLAIGAGTAAADEYGTVIAHRRDSALIGAMLWDWYRLRARTLFAEGLERMTEELPWLDHSPQWKLVAMKCQWGSCSPSGTLSINPHLVKAPRTCIDYVLLHELCHLRIHNHSKGFYRLLTRHMSEWQAIKQRLDGMADQLLAT